MSQVTVYSKPLERLNDQPMRVSTVLWLRLCGDCFRVESPRYSCVSAGTNAEKVFWLLFGTGFRNHSGLANVSASVGASAAEVLFAGKQGDFVGLDQSNVRLSPSLAGRGDVSLALTVDGKTSNTVTLRIK